MKVLDIDLDFFLDGIASSKSTFSLKRLSSKYYTPWKEKDVINFLENNCGLKSKTVSGKFFKHHYEVFFFLRDILRQEAKLIIDHVDAHADLGLGDLSYVIISTNLLQYSKNERINHIKITRKEKDLSSGNYLAYAIACGWLSKLSYIYPKNKGTDLPIFHMKNFDLNANSIQMKYVTQKDIDIFNNRDISYARNNISPLHLEEEVSFNRISEEKFSSIGNYDYVLLTQSPGFTPKESDNLLSLFNNYIKCM